MNRRPIRRNSERDACQSMGDQNAAGGLPSRDDRQAEIAAISHSEGSQRAGGTNKADKALLESDKAVFKRHMDKVWQQVYVERNDG